MKSTLLKRLTHNLWWKIASLVFAVLLWYTVEGEPDLVTSRAVPVYFQGLPGNLLMTADVPAAVRVELRGPASRLSPSSLSDSAIRLDLSTVTAPGERTFTLSSGDIAVPQGVAFLRATPSQVRLAFDRSLARDVPIDVRVTNVPHGMKAVVQDVVPSRVRIAGPEQRVNRIPTAHTDAIDLASVAFDKPIRVNTYVDDPQIRLESSPIVTVKLNLVKASQ